MKFETYVTTSEGGREINEDSAKYNIIGKYGCWAAADGLGGHPGGEIASRIAADAVIKAFSSKPDMSEEALYSYLEAAQASIIEFQDENRKYYSMRTTIVLLVSDSKYINWAYIGDTRLYHFRKAKLFFQSKDHSVPQAMVNGGILSQDEIRFHEDRSKLFRVLGDREHFRPSVNKVPVRLQAGDSLLLCSDGFWEYVDEREMEEDLMGTASPKVWLHSMESRLKLKVKDNYDNYTAIGIFSRKGFLDFLRE